ncbi:DMT family transporter [Butyrivibrio sp. YAB3001]|uniref:DMT family transporter n=1 Tax=Butyrivibrio sp. YAB3001 TaxID=1520812 RepID=UPI0008F6790E|nr:DMT family transporter [Butyrivibrio sp. YAB3001]SFB70329.1 Permease of the drug/metabolite transporter (DMT) superfamily [Butyrivibrio sp. YAB3001]
MNKEKNKQIKSSLLLLLASVVWGAAFVAQSVASNNVGTFTFNGIRFIIGGICLLPLLKGHQLSPVKIPPAKLRGGIICGTALFLASTFQQAGIALGASAGEAGFLTACYIVLVPIIGLIIGRKCSFLIWPAVCIALIGLYLLCIPEATAVIKLSGADTALLMCALLFSVQILCIDHYAPLMNPVSLACVQFIVSGALSFGAAIIFELLPNPALWLSALCTPKAWIAILYTGIFSCAIGYTLQAVGQRSLNPAIASLIMSLESVFSTLFGWIILHQTMTGRESVGCILIFAAVILAQVPRKR